VTKSPSAFLLILKPQSNCLFKILICELIVEEKAVDEDYQIQRLSLSPAEPLSHNPSTQMMWCWCVLLGNRTTLVRLKTHHGQYSILPPSPSGCRTLHKKTIFDTNYSTITKHRPLMTHNSPSSCWWNQYPVIIKAIRLSKVIVFDGRMSITNWIRLITFTFLEGR
jgi:hypothetical protein